MGSPTRRQVSLTSLKESLAPSRVSSVSGGVGGVLVLLVSLSGAGGSLGGDAPPPPPPPGAWLVSAVSSGSGALGRDATPSPPDPTPGGVWLVSVVEGGVGPSGPPVPETATTPTPGETEPEAATPSPPDPTPGGVWLVSVVEGGVGPSGPPVPETATTPTPGETEPEAAPPLTRLCTVLAHLLSRRICLLCFSGVPGKKMRMVWYYCTWLPLQWSPSVKANSLFFKTRCLGVNVVIVPSRSYMGQSINQAARAPCYTPLPQPQHMACPSCQRIP